MPQSESSTFWKNFIVSGILIAGLFIFYSGLFFRRKVLRCSQDWSLGKPYLVALPIGLPIVSAMLVPLCQLVLGATHSKSLADVATAVAGLTAMAALFLQQGMSIDRLVNDFVGKITE